MGAEEHGPWSPLTRDRVVELFGKARFRWWLAGGHALEAHLGRSWRDHDDIDIGIVRADAPLIRQVLSGWDIHMASDGVLTPWTGEQLKGELATVGNLWCRPTPDAPWALDILVGEGDENQWIYKRNPTLTHPWDDAVLRTATAEPYLAPEIQLLFKSKSDRHKDRVDAATLIPVLTSHRRMWLADQLPADHRWQTIIAAYRAGQALSEGDQSVPVELLASGRSSQAWRAAGPDAGLVVRVPIPNSGRILSYRSESLIGESLTDAAQLVSQWEIRSVDGAECSIGRLLDGTPISYEADWTSSFASQLAGVLQELHALPATGWGPLANTTEELIGTSGSAKLGVVDRWFHAPIWPFDGSDISANPISTSDPELVPLIKELERRVLSAAGGPFGVVHSDLHNQHLLEDGGQLTGVLDFGDAFVGAIAWDFALIRWYYGARNAERFAKAYQSAPELTERGALLAIAVGCYKVAKTPQDEQARSRLRGLLKPDT